MSILSQLLSKLKISKIGLKPPPADPCRNGLAVVCIVKNEGLFIGEWVEFHHRVGVKHFYVYDDGSTDQTQYVLSNILPSGAYTIIPWQQRLIDIRFQREIHNQVLAYSHAIANFGGQYRWMAFIDVDEFLVPTQGTDLNLALAHLKDIPNLSLPWHMFGTSGHQHRPTGRVLENYTQRVQNPMSEAAGVRAFKCLVDPTRVTCVRVHSMETDQSDNTWNDRGQKFNHRTRNQPSFYSTQAIQLNHYYTRSSQDLEEKMSRGPNLLSKSNQYQRKVMRTVQSIEANTISDFTAHDLSKILFSTSE